MSYPPGLTEHEKRLWNLAMQWPIPIGRSYGQSVNIKELNDVITVEPSTAHGCPMCSDGIAHTLYFHNKIVPYLKELDRVLSVEVFPQWPPIYTTSSISSNSIDSHKAHAETGEK